MPQHGVAAFRWGSYIDTDLDLATFFSSDHTLVLRFMAQYERAYEGPLLANTGTGTYLVEMGDYAAAGPGAQTCYGHTGGQVNLAVNINGATARYLIPNPALYPADYCDVQNTTSVPPASILPWRHLALVKKGNTLAVWLDAQHLLPMGSATDLALPANAAPTGQLRLGKRLTGTNERETQFYGFIDDLALFDGALGYGEIVTILGQMDLNGNERGLRAGFVFEDLRGKPAPLQRSYTLQDSAYIQEISAHKDTPEDNRKLPWPTQAATYRLPFKRGQVWQVLQAFNSYGTHGSYAAFCWDFIRVPGSAPIGQPWFDAEPGRGEVFLAAAAGQVVASSLGSGSPQPPPSLLQIQTGPAEYYGYEHFVSLTVSSGTQVTEGMELAAVSNVGGGGPHMHFGVADHLESEHDRLVTFPIYFSGYMASDDYGKTWYEVPWGMPRVGQWIRP